MDKTNPKYWVMECVSGIGIYLPSRVKRCIIQANHHGLQQRRRRCFAGNFPVPEPTKTCEVIYPAVAATEWKGCSSKKCMHKRNRLADHYARRATLEECKKVQGFPERYKFFGTKKDQYIQIGNAVCPPVAKAIADSIKNTDNQEVK